MSMNECSHSKRPVWREKTRLNSRQVCLRRFQRFDVIKAERLFTPPHSWRQIKGGSAGRVVQALYIWPPKKTILPHSMAAFVSFYKNNSFHTTLNDVFLGITDGFLSWTPNWDQNLQSLPLSKMIGILRAPAGPVFQSTIILPPVDCL